MQKFNYHTHTYRCKHADIHLSDEDIVKLFIQKGFTKIAFTDHCPEKEIIDPRTRMRMDYCEKDTYLKSIKSLKEKYKDKIEIETGFEVEYLPGQEANLYELKKETNKLILGQHFIYDENMNLKIWRRSDFSDEDLLKYADYIRKAMEKKIPDIIAHPDIYMLSRDKFSENECQVAHLICKASVEYSIPLEINLTEPLFYLIGKREKITYPCKEFWQIAAQYKNLKVVYGVDAHFKEQIELYEQAVAFTNDYLGQDVIDKLHFCNENLEIDKINFD
ncbi:MAG: PHP domain-containing protein [Traorella sp.]